MLQVVNNEHLLLHCRGNSTSFSAQVIRLTNNSGNACQCCVHDCYLLGINSCNIKLVFSQQQFKLGRMASYFKQS